VSGNGETRNAFRVLSGNHLRNHPLQRSWEYNIKMLCVGTGPGTQVVWNVWVLLRCTYYAYMLYVTWDAVLLPRITNILIMFVEKIKHEFYVKCIFSIIRHI
jgi:hypothetical protein